MNIKNQTHSLNKGIAQNIELCSFPMSQILTLEFPRHMQAVWADFHVFFIRTYTQVKDKSFYVPSFYESTKKYTQDHTEH